MRRQYQQRAFTLVEMAIVLLVIGLAIGALWMGAAAVINNTRINTASDQVYQIAAAMRGLYTSRPTVTGADAAFNITLDQSQVFPTDMRRNPATSGGPIDHAWNSTLANGSVTVAAYDLGTSNTSPPSPAARSFRIQFASLPSAVCNQLITHEFVADVSLRLQAIVVRGGSATTFLASSGDLPPPLLTASTACNSSATPSVDWVFSLR
jgi:prepilin-type N-terminal cleavage/methylation domain-containing protein